MKKKIILLNTKKKITYNKCGLACGSGQARRVNLKLNCETNQNARQTKTGWTDPFCHPYL